MNLVSCGDNVKIWDSNGFGLLHQFQPNNTNDDVITDVSWSRDGSMLASVTSRQSLLVVTGVATGGVTQLAAVTELTKPTCCRFCTANSRYICVGSHSGVVDLWDNKNNKHVKQYQGHKAPVTRVCFSAADRHVASASRDGHVIVHNVTSGVLTELPAARNEPQSARDLRYSVARASVLGAAFDSGQVALWDVNHSRLLHSFTAGHVAPAAAIAFSPVNDILLVSVGLDKRLVCYDPKSRSIIQTVVGDAPLTAVDFHSDGVRLAVGTSQGRVCVYDLRTPVKPSRQFAAHRSSVQRVQFQPLVRPSRARASAAGDAQTSSSRTALSSEPAPAAGGGGAGGAAGRSLSEWGEHAAAATAATSSGGAGDTTAGRDQSSVFSPLRDSEGSHVRSTRGSPPSGGRLTHAQSSASAPPSQHQPGRDSSMFSPVRGDVSPAAVFTANAGASSTPVDQVPAAAAAEQSSLFSPVRGDLSLDPAGSARPSPGAADPGRTLFGGAAPAAVSVRFSEKSLRGGGGVTSPDEGAARGRVTVTSERRGVRGGPDGGAADADSSIKLLATSDEQQQLRQAGRAHATHVAVNGHQRAVGSPADVAASSAQHELSHEELVDIAFGPPATAADGWRTEGAVHGAAAVGEAAQAQAEGHAPAPIALVHKIESLHDGMEEMHLGLRQQHFNTQWNVGRHMYEMRSAIESLTSTVESLQVEVARLREENKYLRCKY